MLRRMIVVLVTLAALATMAAAQGVRDERLPAFGEYVYVTELPEAVERVLPEYPAIAREAGVGGTVLVQALVGADGIVRDVRVQKSIPMLDRAALDCVRRWRFKPALSSGEPVAVWVAIPVKFALPVGDGPRSEPLRPAPVTPQPTRPQPAGLSAGPYVIDDDLGDPLVGTHLGTIEDSGIVRVTCTFTNRDWRPNEGTWTPLEPTRDADRPPNVRSGPPGTAPTIDVEKLQKIPVDDLLRHPVWPPEQGLAPGPRYEHPTWPPEWSEGDSRILLAEDMAVDAMPEVERRVAPVRGDDGWGRRVHVGDALVVVLARVGADGAVRGTTIARSVPYFDRAALECVRQWRFRPARRAGQAVPVSVFVPVLFADR